MNNYKPLTELIRDEEGRDRIFKYFTGEDCDRFHIDAGYEIRLSRTVSGQEMTVSIRINGDICFEKDGKAVDYINPFEIADLFRNLGYDPTEHEVTRRYEVWMDEYQQPETNVPVQAQFLGEYEAFSFLEAVKKACDKYGFYKEKIISSDSGSIFMPLMGMFYESEEAARKVRD